MINLMKSIKKIILKNWVSLIWFEITYKIIGFNVIYPFIKAILIKMLNIINVPYISQENLHSVFTQPIAILFTFFAFAVFGFYVYLEIAAIIIYCEKGWQGKYISTLKLWKSSLLELFKIINYKNLPIFLGLLPIIALSFFRFISGNLNKFKIPEFIIEFITDNHFLSITFIILTIFINILTFFYIFGLPNMIIHQKSFIDSWKNSLAILHNKKFKTILILLYCFITFFVFTLFVISIFIIMLFLYSKLFFSSNEAKYIFQTLYTSWSRIGVILLKIFISVFLYATIITLYHYYRKDIQLKIKKTNFSRKIIIKYIFTIFSTFALLAIYSETEMGGNRNFSSDTYTKIVAHRAGATFAPENTISALNTAISDNAHMAEIDVQQLKDGTLIVMHDFNFKRTTGVDKNVWETDYDTIKSFDAGSNFSPKFKSEKVPTLEQMLIAAKNRIDLMIELKSTGHEKDLEKSVINLINKYQMEKQCVIASMNPDILKRTKKLDSSIKTVYISTLFISDKYNSDYIDSYSIEASNLSYEMVAQIHFRGKKVYAWTLNSERTIKRALSCEVDGIVTDNPLLAYYCLNDRGENSLLNFLTEFLYSNV